MLPETFVDVMNQSWREMDNQTKQSHLNLLAGVPEFLLRYCAEEIDGFYLDESGNYVQF